MLKRVARLFLPGRLRRWLQRRKLDSTVASYPRHVVEHRYGDTIFKVELADPLGAGWYDHDWGSLPEITLLASNRLKAGARVFDIGAHQGVVGLMLGHKVGPSGRVVLVEPNEHNLAQCSRNIELNDMPWITTHKAAISDRTGTIPFNCGLNGQAGELSDYAGVIQVEACTVDNLAEQYGLPDVVFVDVEGFECRALAGAVRTLAARIDWFIEVHLGCGLEAAGGSVEQILMHFPSGDFERYIHSENESELIPLDQAPPEKLRSRFFLTAIARTVH